MPHTQEEIAHWMGVVRHMAKGLSCRLPAHIEIEDLIAAGNVGLSEALHRHDTLLSAAFPGYARQRILGAMIDFLRKGDMMTQKARTAYNRLSPEEQLGVLVPMTHSFDDEDPDLCNPDMNPEEAVMHREELSDLHKAFYSLPIRWQFILLYKYGKDKSLREIGRALSVSANAINQTNICAIKRLRAQLSEPASDGSA